jgi:hypothetical protein
MRRRLLNVVTALSLLLCATAALLWVRTDRHSDVCMVAGPGDGGVLFKSHVGGWVEMTIIPDGWGARGVRWWSARHGRLNGGYVGNTGPFLMWQQPADVWAWRPDVVRGEFVLRRGTPAVLLDARTGKPRLDGPVGSPRAAWDNVAPAPPHWRFPQAWEFRAPHWALVLATAALPAARGVRRLARAVRRRKTGLGGLCRHCGYDLRATPERCPECGATATTS